MNSGAGIIIISDWGHGGSDPGAVNGSYKEKDFNMSIGKKVNNILRDKYSFIVVNTRSSDVNVSLSRRADIANQARGRVFISFHINSATNPSARGVETFSFPNSVEGRKLATSIQSSIVKSNIFTSDRGIKEANFAVLRNTIMPSCLVELGFISNSNDLNILINKQDEIAFSVVDGILNYFGIKPLPPTVEIDSDSPSNWARESWGWGKEVGLIDGSKPLTNATREQVISIIERYDKIRFGK